MFPVCVFTNFPASISMWAWLNATSGTEYCFGWGREQKGAQSLMLLYDSKVLLSLGNHAKDRIRRRRMKKGESSNNKGWIRLLFCSSPVKGYRNAGVTIGWPTSLTGGGIHSGKSSHVDLDVVYLTMRVWCHYNFLALLIIEINLFPSWLLNTF